MQLQTYSGDYTRLSLQHKYGEQLTTRNIQLIIVGAAGEGKTLSAENIAEEFYNLGYVVINLYDAKDELEGAFSMYLPKEGYHLDNLRRFGKTPKTIPTKIYHPYTFNIKKNQKYPDFNFFTFNIKELRREDFSMLIETRTDTAAIKLCIDGVEQLKKNEGMYELLHFLQNKVKRQQETHLGRQIFIPDWDNFGLTASSAGTMKDISDISSLFKPFRKDYFITAESCPFNIDIMNILNDNEHYHVFTTRFIKDKKMKEFATFHLFNLIEENLKFARHPVCFIIEEVRFLVPDRSDGYKVFMAENLQAKLSTIRNKGRGCSTIMTTQVLSDVNEKVVNSATETLIGRLGGAKDLERIAKALKYSREVVEEINSLRECTYIRKGYEDSGAVKVFLPSHAHKEEHYNFFQMYKKYYPERMRLYNKQYNYMLALLKSEIDDIKEKVTKKIRKQKKDIEEDVKRKEKQEKLKTEIQKLKEEKREKRKDEHEFMQSEIVRLRNEGNSFSEIAELFDTSAQNIHRIFKKIEKKQQKD